MSRINIRTKGKSGEYEFIDKFGPLWSAFTDLPCERNLDQVRCGGSDITNVTPFSVEVKRHEDCCNGNKNNWWKQVVKATAPDEIPIVAFRPNRQKWRFLISTSLIGIDDGRYMEIEVSTFTQLVIMTMESKYGTVDNTRFTREKPSKSGLVGSDATIILSETQLDSGSGARVPDRPGIDTQTAKRHNISERKVAETCSTPRFTL